MNTRTRHYEIDGTRHAGYTVLRTDKDEAGRTDFTWLREFHFWDRDSAEAHVERLNTGRAYEWESGELFPSFN
jgi:hypothetical protein